MKKHYIVNWDILQAVELFANLPESKPTPQVLINRVYSGNGMRLMHTPVPRLWIVSIETKAKATNGEIHTLNMTYKPDSKVRFSSLMNLIRDAWIRACDVELADMDALSAKATARCFV